VKGVGETVMASVEKPCQHLSEGAEENNEKPFRIASYKISQ
jgi:hypothetical protein